MVESSEYFRVKVRTLDSSQFELSVTESTLISEVKEMIASHTQIPSDRQRLIYQGKLLKNQDSMATYKIKQGHVLQLVGNAAQTEAPRQEEEEPRNNSLTDIIRLALENNPGALFSRRRRRFQRRRDIDSSERLETIRQTLQTIEGMLACMNGSTHDSENPQGFNFANREFYRGQWVDVKDTVDQWLEAQIVDIQTTPQGSMVFIHYNGWPNRWDEWIEVSSPRIQPIRTHTLQSLTSPVHSPYPVIPCDAEGLRGQNSYDLNEFIIQSSSLLEHVKGMMERFYSLQTIMRHEQASERVQPLRERLNMIQPEEEKQWVEAPRSSDSEATAGSQVDDTLSMELEESFSQQETDMTTEQELALLTVQLAPILDRAGRLLSDLAGIIGGNSRVVDDTASVSSSLITNESGVSSNSGPRHNMQVPVMPPPSELFSSSPRVFGPDIDIHIHAIFAQRNAEVPREDQPQPQEPERTPCWRQLS